MTGKRKSSSSLDAAVAEARATGAPTDDVAEKHGVKARTLRRRLSEMPASAPKPAAAAKAPKGRAPSPTDLEAAREEVRSLDDRILLARHPLAGAELVEGRAKALEGEAALEAWLGRPFPDDTLDGDTLVATQRLLGQLVGRFQRARNGREASGLAEKILGGIGRVEQILARRPSAPRPDAVLEELRRLDLDAIARIEEHLADPIRPEEVHP